MVYQSHIESSNSSGKDCVVNSERGSKVEFHQSFPSKDSFYPKQSPILPNQNVQLEPWAPSLPDSETSFKNSCETHENRGHYSFASSKTYVKSDKLSSKNKLKELPFSI